METSLLLDEHPKTPTAEPRRASPTRILQQRVRNGDLRLTGAARPSIGAAEVLVATTHSVVSAGTERAVRGLASAGLVAKARSRPDLVRQVLAKAKADGPLPVLKSVRNRLEEQMPLGYSGVGTVSRSAPPPSGWSPASGWPPAGPATPSCRWSAPS